MEKSSRINNRNFYKNKKVLITGHTGFKGSWMVNILNYLGANISGFALEPEAGCLYLQTDADSFVKSHIGHLEDFDSIKKTILEEKPEVIIHFAAFCYVNGCFENPRRAYATNVMGTVNLLEAVRECDFVKSIVVVSTDKVYFNKGDGAIYSEQDMLGGDGPYSCSKTCMDMIVKDYYDTYFKNSERKIGIGIVRASNVLSGGDHVETRLIPSILKSIDEGKPVELRNPSYTRPWQSVLDALDGYLTVARFLYNDPIKYSGAYNIGPSREGIQTVGWIFEKMVTYFNGLESKNTKALEVHESETLGLDITKAVTILDWEPRVSIDKIVELVVDFYKAQKCGDSSFSICQRQIKEYYGE